MTLTLGLKTECLVVVPDNSLIISGGILFPSSPGVYYRGMQGKKVTCSLEFQTGRRGGRASGLRGCPAHPR